MENSRIFFFTQLYYPDITTTAIIMSDLAEDLAFYGFNIHVCCAQPTYFLKQKCPKSEVRNGVSIRRVRSFLLDKNKILGRLLNSTSCFISMFFEIIRANKKDLLILNTNPALLPLLGLIGAGITGRKYVVLIHDLWPELPAHMGMIRKGGFLFKVIDFLNTLSFKNSSCIIVLSESMKNAVLKKAPGMKESIYVIHNWADETRIFPVPKEDNPLLDVYGLKEKKVVMYSGNLGRYQPLEVMIEAAEKMKARKDIVFLFAGNGAKQEGLQEMVKKKALKNVRFLPFQPMERLAESLSMADVSLMGISSENEGVIMPSKLYGLLAVGKPIISVSSSSSEVTRILKKAKAGIHSKINDPEDLAKNILSILDNPDKAQEMGTNGRVFFLKNFERKKITMQWKNILESLFMPEISRSL